MIVIFYANTVTDFWRNAKEGTFLPQKNIGVLSFLLQFSYELTFKYPY